LLDGKIYPESAVSTLLRNVGFYPPKYKLLICVSPNKEIYVICNPLVPCRVQQRAQLVPEASASNLHFQATIFEDQFNLLP
jgi:hypothetical protein